MPMIAGLAGLVVLVAVLWDAFETIVLPRRVTRRLRLTTLFYRYTWIPWRTLACRFPPGPRRENLLGYYGPFSLLLLLIMWAALLVIGFGLVQSGLGSAMTDPDGVAGFGTDLYESGTTFFTLGLGDVTPHGELARVVSVVEAGTGFGFLGLVIGYLPVLYQAFSRRETNISLLDARAGSPPTAGDLLLRLGPGNHLAEVSAFLQDWERWAAELLEGHLSYPVLAFYRSQHENQSWVAALTMILDVCALMLAGKGADSPVARPARLTFAMARHAAVDLALIFNTAPHPPQPDRLPPADLDRLCGVLAEVGIVLAVGPAMDQRLGELRQSYEPYVNALATYLCFTLPPFLPAAEATDNWQTTAWERSRRESLL